MIFVQVSASDYSLIVFKPCLLLPCASGLVAACRLGRRWSAPPHLCTKHAPWGCFRLLVANPYAVGLSMSSMDTPSLEVARSIGNFESDALALADIHHRAQLSGSIGRKWRSHVKCMSYQVTSHLNSSYSCRPVLTVSAGRAGQMFSN